MNKKRKKHRYLIVFIGKGDQVGTQYYLLLLFHNTRNSIPKLFYKHFEISIMYLKETQLQL